MPKPAPDARATRTDLAPSPALSLQQMSSATFKGRVMRIMLTDGFDGALLAVLEAAVTKAGGWMKFIAPTVGGVLCGNNNLHAVHEKIGSAPSVQFDAVVILPGRETLATTPAAITFLRDAFVHCKFIGWAEDAMALLDVCGLGDTADVGVCRLTDKRAAEDFVATCTALRHWRREALFI